MGKEMTSVKEILSELGYNINQQGNSLRCRALYRNGDGENSISVDSRTGQFFDFPRGKGGSIFELIRLTLNLQTVEEAEKWTANKNFNLDYKEPKPILKLPRIINENELFLLPHNYWKEKGISDSTIKIFKGGVAHSGSLNRRYVFPIYNELGDVIGLSGRSVVGAEPKWKHIGRKSEWVFPYFLNHLYIKEANSVILTEGIGDTLALWESGFKNSLVMFGIKISPAIISKLIEISPEKIIIATNNDLQGSGAGNVAANEIEFKLLKFFDSERIIKAIPQTTNDLMDLYEKEGATGIRGWYNGLFLE